MSCQDVRTEIENLNEVRLDTIAKLHVITDPSERADLVWEFKQISQSQPFKRRKLDRCLEEESGLSPLLTQLMGSYTLTMTHPDALGPYEGSLEIGVLFSTSRDEVTITSFPELQNSSTTPVGDNVTTISKISGGSGTFDKATGHFAVVLGLRFDHSNVFIGDSTLSLMFSTGSVGELQGSPLNTATRALTLVGRGMLNGGHLGGATADLIVMGKLETLP